MVLFGSISLASILILAIVLITRSDGADNGPIFTANQTQRLLLGSDDMLNAGDVIEITTVVFNNDASILFNNITVMDSIEIGTICNPLGLTNSIAFINPESNVECFGIYVITQPDIDEGSFELSSIVSFALPNGTVLNATVESSSDLRQTTFGQLSVDQMYTFDLMNPGFLDVDDLLRVTVKIMNTGTETLLNLESTSFNGILQPELLPMTSVNFTYILNLTLVDFNLTFVLLNETATTIGRTSAQSVDANSLLTVNSTRIPFPVLRTSTTLATTTPCAQIGDVVLVEVLLENIGTTAAVDLTVTSSLVGTNLVCGPMGTGNLVTSLFPGESILCNSGYMLTGTNVRFGYDTSLDTSTIVIASNFQQVFAEANVNLIYSGVFRLYYNIVDNFADASNGVSLVDFSFGAPRVSGITAPQPGCLSTLYVPRFDDVSGEVATFTNFRLNLTKHQYAVLSFRSFTSSSSSIFFQTVPSNLFATWGFSDEFVGLGPGSSTFNSMTGRLDRMGLIKPILNITNLPDIQTISMTFLDSGPSSNLHDIDFYEIVDTTI